VTQQFRFYWGATSRPLRGRLADRPSCGLDSAGGPGHLPDGDSLQDNRFKARVADILW
jgi:hypothetical protein